MRAGMLVAAAFLALAACSYGGTAKAPGGIEFTYYDPSAYSVSLVGSFNNWNGQTNPMIKDKEGTWRLVLPLTAGKYEYKFMVNGSTWMADPDNPRTVGDYGNSALDLDKDGNPVVAGPANVISNTAANARVAIDGWFRGTYTTRKDARAVYGTGTAGLGDARWRLSRPAHEMYVSVNPTIGSDVKGSATLRIDSGVGDIREVRTDLYSARLTFTKSRFDVMGYHNEEVASFDDPMEMLGHVDLPGSPLRDNIDFGRGTQGIMGTLRVQGAELTGLYSNAYDYDIYDSPLAWKYNAQTEAYDSLPRYDNVGTDLLALRAKRTLGGLACGLTYVSRRNGWWIPFEGQNTSSAIDRYRADSGDSASYWFEMGTTDWFLGGDLRYQVIAPVAAFAEYGRTSYEAKWDAGNRVRKQGDQFVDGKIDVPVGNEAGTRAKFGFEASRGDNALAVSYERLHAEGMRPDETYVTKDALPFEDPDNSLIDYYGRPLLAEREYRNTYVGVQNLDRFVVYEQAPLPERTFGTTHVGLSAKRWGLSFALDVDVSGREWQYTSGERSKYNLTWTRVVPSIAGGLFKERLTYKVLYETTKDNLSGRMPTVFDRDQVIIEGELALKANWGLYYNFRRVGYDWTGVVVQPAGGGVRQPSQSDKSFFDPHVALVWSPIPKVEIRLGYGLNPLYYRDTPVEGREIGRERWMSSYLWLDPQANLIEAEKALEDLKMISLMGVISF
ncbi:MAG TPA: glycogen-binding domain-containing protein [bacterium]|nr:glycogen-binding domain-containing protein [bacterium]